MLHPKHVEPFFSPLPSSPYLGRTATSGCASAGFTGSTTVLLELPVSVVQRADLPGLKPSGDAVEVEGMLFALVSSLIFSSRSEGARQSYIADSPRDGALLTGG